MSGKRPEILHTRFRYEWEFLIDQCIFDENYRIVLKKYLLDGKTAEWIVGSGLVPIDSVSGIWDIISKGEAIIFREAARRPSEREKTE